MPVVVDEVVISVDVNNQQSGGSTQRPAATEQKQEMIQECVERVLEVLEQRRER